MSRRSSFFSSISAAFLFLLIAPGVLNDGVAAFQPRTKYTSSSTRTRSTSSNHRCNRNYRQHQRQHKRSVGESKSQRQRPSQSRLQMADVLTSPEPIHAAFTVATFLPQPFWLLMILFPKSSVTKNIMGGLEIPLLCSLVHLVIVASSIAVGGSDATAPLAEFNDVFDPAGDPQKAFMGMTSNYPNFVAEEWSHVLTWDLFVGRWIWIDGLRRGVFTPVSVLFCNLIGPPGLLLHWLTCTVTGKPIFEPSEKEEIEQL